MQGTQGRTVFHLPSGVVVVSRLPTAPRIAPSPQRRRIPAAPCLLELLVCPREVCRGTLNPSPDLPHIPWRDDCAPQGDGARALHVRRFRGRRDELRLGIAVRGRQNAGERREIKTSYRPAPGLRGREAQAGATGCGIGETATEARTSSISGRTSCTPRRTLCTGRPQIVVACAAQVQRARSS